MADLIYGPVTAFRIGDQWIVKPERITGRMATTQDEQLVNWFTHHPPQSPAEAGIYQEIRKGGRELAELIADEVPEGAELDEALRHVRAAVMWANAGIACGPKIGDKE